MKTPLAFRRRAEEAERQQNLLDTLASENVELKYTVEMLQSKGESKQFIKDNLSLKKELKAKEEECRSLEEKLNKAYVDLQVYSAVDEQLDKLEVLQNRLMTENAKMRRAL